MKLIKTVHVKNYLSTNWRDCQKIKPRKKLIFNLRVPKKKKKTINDRKRNVVQPCQILGSLAMLPIFYLFLKLKRKEFSKKLEKYACGF